VYSILAVLLLVLAAGLTQAQGPIPSGRVGVQAAMGTAFTYQGQLKKAGNPVNGNCDFLFTLWDAETGGNQIGLNQEKTNVPVTNGLFTVQLDFGAGAFQGDARWLQIAVKCAGDSDYVPLTPRQALTPAPYALALPGLWTQQNANSPNVIGGYSGNSVTAGVYGATIGGGGASGATNRVTANYATVGGGYGNNASADYATVGGGGYNTASARYATVGGGEHNTASAYTATVSGGKYNSASGIQATVGGGAGNSASGIQATVGGGVGNQASGRLSTVPGGYGAAATHYSEMAYASGYFATYGDAQTSTYVMRIERTCDMGTWYDLYLNGNDTPSEFLTIAPGRTVAFDALVVGRTQTGESAGYHIRGVVENVGGTVSIIGTPLKTVLGEDDPNWDVQALTGFGALVIQVQGNGETIRWVATVRTVEVSW
jgi:hypothetical protein